MKVAKAVALRVSMLLKENGMSKYRLEKKMAIPHNTMQSIFREETDGINLKTVMLMIKGLELTPSEFFDNELFDFENLDI